MQDSRENFTPCMHEYRKIFALSPRLLLHRVVSVRAFVSTRMIGRIYSKIKAVTSGERKVLKINEVGTVIAVAHGDTLSASSAQAVQRIYL
jgi:hypothetical protein